MRATLYSIIFIYVTGLRKQKLEQVARQNTSYTLLQEAFEPRRMEAQNLQGQATVELCTGFSIYKQTQARRSNDAAPSDLFLACCSAAFVQLCLQADAAAISDAALSSTGFSACACCCFCCPQQARAFGTAPAFHAFPQLACSPKPCTPSRCRGLR